MADLNRTIDQLQSALKAHGYIVVMEPIEGQEELFAGALREGFAKVETTLAFNARRYGFRGLSRKALTALHRDLPSPTWGVEVSA